jgi:glucosamine-6-phosphate deaminase
VTRIDLRTAADEVALARIAADVVEAVVARTPDARVVVATGRSPLGTYRELATRVECGSLDTARITAFQLDEYLDLDAHDDRSLTRWAMRTFVEPLRIADERFIRLPLDDAGLAAYDEAVRDAGGYDLAILGIGTNGHVGFNEPPSDASTPSRVVELTPSSLASNAAYWGDGRVPRLAATIGLEPLLASRTIVLLASGSAKRAILQRALYGPVTPEVPASYLRRADRVVVVVDAAAAPPRSIDGGAS